MKIAVLYQCQQPPMRDGLIKPLKKGGYSDSGADIAYCLYQNDVSVVTPAKKPSVFNDYDWVFPDTAEGINRALQSGADILWLNTVL